MNFKSITAFLLALFCMSASLQGQQIEAGRAIQITISGVPPTEKQRFDLIYPVSESGMINMPLIGQVRAAGLSGSQLASSLQSLYKSAGIYTTPTFQVVNSGEQGIEQQFVHIGGLVARPGPVKWTRGLTLYQAIQAAGGATPFGSMYRVKLFRGERQKQYDLTNAKYMHIPLEAKDTIEVPQKGITGR
jgi:polysaccharide export outer membrane protein